MYSYGEKIRWFIAVNGVMRENDPSEFNATQSINFVNLIIAISRSNLRDIIYYTT